MKAMQRIGALGALLAVLFVSGCASVTKQKENLYPEAQPDKGLVYFMREKKFVGGAVSYKIRHNDKVIGALANGTYFFYFSEPGEQTFVAKTESESSRTLKVEGGKTYYIKGEVDMGFFVGRPSLTIVADQEGESLLRDLRYATTKSD